MRMRPLLWSIIIFFPFSVIDQFESGGTAKILVVSGFFIYAIIVSITLMTTNVFPWFNNPFFESQFSTVVSSHRSSCGMPEENNSRGYHELS